MPFDRAEYVDASRSQFNDIQGSQYNYFSTSNSELENVFQALRRESVMDAQYNSRDRYPPPCDPDTRVEVLAKIREWVSEPAAHTICLLYGIAGTGKSAIAQSVSEFCAETSKLAASFFFDRQEEMRCSTVNMVATIAYQLTISVPALKQPICDVLMRDRTILNTVFDNQLQKLIVEPLQSLPESDSSLIIVIDALDECKDGFRVAQLMTLLSHTASNPCLPFRFFVTSRPEPLIRAIFRDANMNVMTFPLDLQAFTPESDIRSFLQRRLREIRRTRHEVMSGISPSWPSNDELDSLVAKSSDLFIFASTVVKFIGDSRTIPHVQLRSVLRVEDDRGLWKDTDLDRLYKQVLSASPHPDRLKVVLGAIILLGTPVTLHCLAQFLALDLECVQLVLENLHSILSIPENADTGPVTPFHLSLRDFLTSEDRSGIYFIDPVLKHTDLAKRCLNCIATLPKFTFPTFRDPIHCWGLVMEHLQQRDKVYRVVTRYACRHWSYHLSESSPGEKDLAQDVKELCRHYAIPWRMFLEIDAQHEEQQEQQDDVQQRMRERTWVAKSETKMLRLDTWLLVVLVEVTAAVSAVLAVPVVPVAIVLLAVVLLVMLHALLLAMLPAAAAGMVEDWTVELSLLRVLKQVMILTMVVMVAQGVAKELGLWLGLGLLMLGSVLGLGLRWERSLVRRLSLEQVQAKEHNVERYVLYAKLCINMIAFPWRSIFYQALITTQRSLDRRVFEGLSASSVPQTA